MDMSDDVVSPNRRDILRSALATSLVPGVLTGTDTPSNSENIIVAENAKVGHGDWQLTRVAMDRIGGIRSPRIEGYCSQQSVAAGETIEFKISVDPMAQFQIDIFRMGYYGGAGARLMRTLGPLAGKPQPLPEIGPQRLRECRWETSAEISI